jgi:hypothetical protein
MTTELATKNRIKFSCDGDCYAIPESMNNEFDRLNEEMQNADSELISWFDSRNDFNQAFAKYKKD